jgi:molecular chaperone GrpE (heat shock protein)
MDNPQPGQERVDLEPKSDVPLERDAASGGQKGQGPIKAGEAAANIEAATAEVVKRICSIGEEQLAFAKLSHAMLGKISDEMERYGEQAVAKLQRSVFVELAMLYDSLQEAIAWVRGATVPPQEAVLDRLDTLRIELLEILARRDVRLFDEKPAVLDRRLCRTVKTVLTAEPSEDNVVFSTVRDGFLWGEQVLRPEEVVIKKYRPETMPKGE